MGVSQCRVNYHKFSRPCTWMLYLKTGSRRFLCMCLLSRMRPFSLQRYNKMSLATFRLNYLTRLLNYLSRFWFVHLVYYAFPDNWARYCNFLIFVHFHWNCNCSISCLMQVILRFLLLVSLLLVWLLMDGFSISLSLTHVDRNRYL